MENFDFQIIEPKLNKDLEVSSVSGRIVLDRLRLIDEDSRKTAAYMDHKYAPFYYHLGKYVSPKSFLEFGFDLGLLSCSFFTSCKTVQNFLGYRETPSVATRIGKSNIKLRFKGDADFYSGNLTDETFQRLFLKNDWDLILMNCETSYDKHLEYLDTAWGNTSEFGIIVAEYIDRHQPAKEAFAAFSQSKNRKPTFFKTRYGTGIIQK